MIKIRKSIISLFILIATILIGGISITVVKQSNYVAYADEVDSVIELTINGVVAPDHEYDAKNDTIELNGGNLIGILEGDDVGFILNNGKVSDISVAQNVPVNTSIELTGADADKYQLLQPDYVTVNIVPLAITINGVFSPTHKYDNSNTVDLSGGELVGVLDNDALNVSFILNKGSVDNGDVKLGTDGTYEATHVSTNIVLQGDSAKNYFLIQPTDIDVIIEPAELTVRNVLAPDHIYDGNTIVELSGGELVGVYQNDSVSFIRNSGVVSSKDVGQDIEVSTNIILSGRDASNYTLKQPTDVTVNILKKPISIRGVIATNRFYNGTTAVDLMGGELSGVLESDKENIGFNLGDGLINNKSASLTPKNVYTSIKLTGEGSKNYLLNQPTDIKVSIDFLHVDIINAEAVNKIYDGTRAIAINGGVLDGVIAGDHVLVDSIDGFVNNKNVSLQQCVTLDVKLSGVDSANYIVDSPTDLYADIYAKTVTLDNVIGTNRVYDGANTVSLSNGSLNGVIPGDKIEFVISSATIPNSAVGEYAVDYNVLLVGADAINYVLESKSQIKIQIICKELAVENVKATSRTYDGTNKIALIYGSLVGVILNDDVTLEESFGYADDKNVGTNKSIITDFKLIGADKSNYNIKQQTLIADITPKEVKIVNVFADNRQVNDDCTVALHGGEILGIIPTDDVRLSLGVGHIADKIKGEYIVSTNIEIVGIDAINYTFTQPSDISVKIFSKDLDISNTIWMVLTIIEVVVIVLLICLYFIIMRKKKVPATNLESIYEGVPDQIHITGENELVIQLQGELTKAKAEIDRLRSEITKPNDVPFKIVKVLLPFIEKMLLNIHMAQDENEDNFRIKNIKSAIDKFLLQTIQIQGIEMVYSEVEAPESEVRNNQEISEVICTDDIMKNNKIYRTVCPGVIYNGELLIHEKVIIWQTKGNT